jgi:hypothetical protein
MSSNSSTEHVRDRLQLHVRVQVPVAPTLLLRAVADEVINDPLRLPPQEGGESKEPSESG